MTRNPDVLDRLAPLSGAPSRGFESLVRLRAKRQLARKIGAIAVVAALVVALLGIGLGTLGDRATRPADPPDESVPPAFAGMVVRYTGQVYGTVGDLVAEDPRSGETITLVEAGTGLLARDRVYDPYIAWAAASPDGRWIAYERAICDDEAAVARWEELIGIWITNGIDEPKQLTAPCAEHPGDFMPEPEGRWAWSPAGSRLAIVEDNHLVLVDPATGDRTDLGQAVGDVTSLAWSPDGTRIAYATVPTGSLNNGISLDGSVHALRVDGGEHVLLAESVGRVPGGEEGAGLAWSPDGEQIAVIAEAGSGTTLYVMNPDGSDRRRLAEGVLIEHILGSPNLAWSPDGARIAYATAGDERKDLQIWNAPADGSTPVLVFDPASESPSGFGLSGGPVWSPNGSGIAFRYSPTDEEKDWLIANADGTGEVREIKQLKPLSWRGGWYFCECYG